MPDTSEFMCRACNERFSGVPFTAQEMLLETHEPFDYVECTVCGSIQIVAIPADLARFYPDAYRQPQVTPGRVGRFLRRQRGSNVRGARWNLVGALLLRVSRPE